MVFIKPVTPFINSIYEIHDLSLDLQLISQGVSKHLETSVWIQRAAGSQTQNLTEVIPEFLPMFKQIDIATADILRSWGINTTPKLSLHFINIDKNYSVSEPHCHANCILSGVFYVDVPDGSGAITFYRPDNQEYQFKAQHYNNPYINRNYVIEPKPNMAIIFPPHMKHGVGVSRLKDQDSRVSIAFDYVI